METVEELRGIIADREEQITLLLAQNDALRQKNANLERLVAMYDQLSKAEALDLIDADHVAQAHEANDLLSRQELADAYDTIRAHEEVESISEEQLRLMQERLETVEQKTDPEK